MIVVGLIFSAPDDGRRHMFMLGLKRHCPNPYWKPPAFQSAEATPIPRCCSNETINVTLLRMPWAISACNVAMASTAANTLIITSRPVHVPERETDRPLAPELGWCTAVPPAISCHVR